MKLCFFILCCFFVPFLAHGATRVALVSLCTSDSGKDLLALAEARLSTEKEVVLVERTQVERICGNRT